MMCAVPLAVQNDCPILLTEKDKLNKETIKELKRLKVESAYIIGGPNTISNNIEKELKDMNISNKRIYGKDRYDTSIEIANVINKSSEVKEIVVANGLQSIQHTTSMSSVAGNKNIPIIISKENNLKDVENWVKDKNIKNTYIIGENPDTNKLPNTKLIYGNDIYETNANIIEEFYKDKKDYSLFFCKGKQSDKDDLVDSILISPLAAKKYSPVVILGQDLSKYQRESIEKINIKNMVQVGKGIGEKVKDSLYEIKRIQEDELENPEIEVPIEPDKPEIVPPIDIEKPDEPEIIPPIDIEKPDEPEIIPPIDIEKPDEPEIVPPIDIEKPDEPEIAPPIDPEDTEEPEVIPPIDIEKPENEIVVKDIKALREALKNNRIDTINLGSNITSDGQITIDRPVTIDGINEYGQYSIIYRHHIGNLIQVSSDNVELKNLDIDSYTVGIQITNSKEVKLSNINAFRSKNTSRMPLINIQSSTVEANDIELASDYEGIKMESSINKLDTELIIKGDIYNIKQNENLEYNPTIVIKDIDNKDEVKSIIIDENLDSNYIDNNYIYKTILDEKTAITNGVYTKK